MQRHTELCRGTGTYEARGVIIAIGLGIAKCCTLDPCMQYVGVHAHAHTLEDGIRFQELLLDMIHSLAASADCCNVAQDQLRCLQTLSTHTRTAIQTGAENVKHLSFAGTTFAGNDDTLILVQLVHLAERVVGEGEAASEYIATWSCSHRASTQRLHRHGATQRALGKKRFAHRRTCEEEARRCSVHDIC